MRSGFKCYKLLKIAMGEEKMPEEGDARDRWIEKSAVLYDLVLQSVNNDMFQHIKDLVELDDSGPKAWKLLRDVIQPNTLPMVIVLEKELAALSMRPGDDVKPVLDKIKDTYARMAAAGSNVSQMQQCTKIISVLDNSWDNLIPTLNTQQDQWTPEWLRQQILQEDFRRRHTGGGAANKTAEGYGPCADEEVVGESDRKLFHSMVGALSYAANHTLPTIAFATSRLASVVSHPSHEQLEAAKRLVRYVSTTASVGLEYSAVRQRLQRSAADLGKGEMLLTCYTDASFNSVKADGTSIGGYVCLFGGGAVAGAARRRTRWGSPRVRQSTWLCIMGQKRWCG
ncbi:unnamed protein product [Closterium sp. NIES-53]